MPNLITDPSFEANIAPTSVGTPTSSARSSDYAHAGIYSWKVVTDAANEGIQFSITTVVGSFYRLECYVWINSGTIRVQGVAFQNGVTTSVSNSIVGKWVRMVACFRATAVSTIIQLLTNGAITFYVDDIGCTVNDPVTLTATPASLANSLEGTGIRVDGLDLMSAPLSKVSATKGIVTFSYTPRHTGSAIQYLNLIPIQICSIYGDGNNYIKLLDSGSSFIQYKIGGGPVVRMEGFTFLANTMYDIAIAWIPSAIMLYVNGLKVSQHQVSVNFSTTPSSFIGGE